MTCFRPALVLAAALALGACTPGPTTTTITSPGTDTITVETPVGGESVTVVAP